MTSRSFFVTSIKDLERRSDFRAVEQRLEDVLDGIHRGAFDSAKNSATGLESDIGNAEETLGELRERGESLDVVPVDAISDDDIDGQLATLEADIEVAASIRAAIVPLTAGDDLFWPAHEKFTIEKFEKIGDDFEEAEEEFEAASEAVDVETESSAFGEDLTRIQTYVTSMNDGASRFDRATGQHQLGRYHWAADNFGEGQEFVETALETGLRDVEPEEFEYISWKYSGPEFAFETETWLEDDVLYITTTATNESPWTIEGMFVAYIEYDNGRENYTHSTETTVELDPGESWETDEPWTQSPSNDYYPVDAEIVLQDSEWGAGTKPRTWD